ncbi:cyclase family protein [Kitasatospora nipponensis]|uniref:Cyclase family protein n=1 Tax=Kitasatospora nipponensis TaxID=258049 RepID=A0ABP4HM43_9ACTN
MDSPVTPQPAPAPVLLDLTHQVTTGMPVYPGDPEVALRPALTTDTAGVNVLSVHLGSQSGTHVDAPYHVDVTWPTLDGLPLELFTGPAVVADLRALPPRSAVGPEQLAPALARLTPGAVLLLATGWPRFWGTERYLAHPYLSAAAAEAIVAAGVRTVGVDALSVDPTPDAEPADPAVAALLAGLADEHDARDGLAAADAPLLTAHRILLGAPGGGVIAENLTDLTALLEAQARDKPLSVSLFPLRLAAADGAPVRAVARIG